MTKIGFSTLTGSRIVALEEQCGELIEQQTWEFEHEDFARRAERAAHLLLGHRTTPRSYFDGTEWFWLREDNFRTLDLFFASLQDHQTEEAFGPFIQSFIEDHHRQLDRKAEAAAFRTGPGTRP